MAESEDISKQGIFVRTDELLPVNSILELRIVLPDEQEFRVIARVAHLLSMSSARALGRHTGMGFEFLDLDENEGRRRLIVYLDDLIEEFTPIPRELPTTSRVLVADPSRPLVDRLSNALVQASFEVSSAANGAEAYARCRDEVPDILVATERMPVMDGWTLIRMLQGNARLTNIPVVLLSEDGSDMTRLQAYRLGVRDFVHKPFTDEELVIRLRRITVASTRPTEAAGLFGDLGEISLATLLSLLEFERKSGILVMLRDDQAARLFVADGVVVKLEGPGDKGTPFERMLSLLDWESGNFEFSRCDVVGQNEVGLSTSLLLLEHARISDEQGRL